MNLQLRLIEIRQSPSRKNSQHQRLLTPNELRLELIANREVEEAVQSVDDITAALAALDTADDATKLESVLVCVCDATQTEWNVFTMSEAEVAFHLKDLEWDRGKIYIVEPPSFEHSFIAAKIDMQMKTTPARHEYLNGYLDTDVPVGGTNRRPDSSCGRAPRVVIPL
jgi:hypothetical protein